MSLNPPLSASEAAQQPCTIAWFPICVTGLQVPRKLASVTFLSGNGAWHALVSPTRSNTSRVRHHQAIYSRTEAGCTSKKISGNMSSYSSILNEEKRTFMELSEYFVPGGRPDMQTALPRSSHFACSTGFLPTGRAAKNRRILKMLHAVQKENFESRDFPL
jgi:hypothetical protein